MFKARYAEQNSKASYSEGAQGAKGETKRLESNEGKLTQSDRNPPGSGAASSTTPNPCQPAPNCSQHQARNNPHVFESAAKRDPGRVAKKPSPKPYLPSRPRPAYRHATKLSNAASSPTSIPESSSAKRCSTPAPPPSFPLCCVMNSRKHSQVRCSSTRQFLANLPQVTTDSIPCRRSTITTRVAFDPTA